MTLQTLRRHSEKSEVPYLVSFFQTGSHIRYDVYLMGSAFNVGRHQNKRRAVGQWFSRGTPVTPTNKTDHHDITDEILLKVALINITLTITP